MIRIIVAGVLVTLLSLLGIYYLVSEMNERSNYLKSPLSRQEVHDLLGGESCIAGRLRERLVDGDEPVEHFEVIRYQKQCNEMKILRNQREALK